MKRIDTSFANPYRRAQPAAGVPDILLTSGLAAP
jgi:hypothetical protein